MRKYEMGVVFKPGLDEESLKAEIEKVKALIERFEGAVEKIDEWGKRRLAYEIDYINEGFYVFYTFESETKAPSEIESRMRIMETVIRYLIIKLDE